jgi:hypothetical protein
MIILLTGFSNKHLDITLNRLLFFISKIDLLVTERTRNMKIIIRQDVFIANYAVKI